LRVTRISSQEVPPVPFEIPEHGQAAVRFIARRRDEPHTSGDHALVHGLEVIGYSATGRLRSSIPLVPCAAQTATEKHRKKKATEKHRRTQDEFFLLCLSVFFCGF